jgi:hypothetical protein
MKIDLFLRHLVVTLEGMEKEYETGYNNGYFSVDEVLGDVRRLIEHIKKEGLDEWDE